MCPVQPLANIIHRVRLIIHGDEGCLPAELLVYFSLLKGTAYTDQLTVVVVVPNVRYAFA
jgi:hypothetical protein